MRRNNSLLPFLLVVFFTAPVQLSVAQKLSPKFKSQVVVVQFEEGIVIENGTVKANLAQFDHTGTKYGVYKMERVFPFLDHVAPTPRTAQNLLALRRTYYVYYGAEADPGRVSKEFALNEGVVYAEPVLINRFYESITRTDPNDPKYQEQTYLKHMRLPEAWEIIKAEDASEPVVIAIVDDGADWQHEDLAKNVWTNEDEIANNGIDDDRNGVIDDVHGANFGDGNPMNNDPTAESGNSHGTATSSVAGAVSNNATGIAGAAWNAKLMHINVFCQTKGVCNGYEAIVYAAVSGADIINTSWGAFAGDREFRMIAQSLDFATDSGALVVAAAGNGNKNADAGLEYPGGHPRVLSVGATERDSRKRASFSEYGKTVGVFAPGVNIITATPENEYDNFRTGTSFSAPLVSGVAALVKARFPDISPDSLREQLRLSSENMDAQNPDYAGYLGRGFINAEASLRPPTFPAVRVKHWSWEDDDGDSQIDPGDEVTINATMVNYLADAQQLVIELMEAEPHPHITLVAAEQSVGVLRGGDSVKVKFRFSVSADVSPGHEARFYVRIRDGAFMDETDALQFFGINQRIDLLYTGFKALYLSTDGENWDNNSGWDISAVPTAEQMSHWHGVAAIRGQIDGLALRDNNLTGSIPPELGQARGISALAFTKNSITGSIPPELGQLLELTILDLGMNSLSGPIPPNLGKLSNLEYFDVLQNSLSGPIPSELGQLSKLKILDLGTNALSGPIPSDLGKLSKLVYLDLGNNSLSGPIPSELRQLPELLSLNLANNALIGTIPPELGQLSKLALLDLSGNSLTGRIPRSFLQLKNLLSFSFSGQDLCAPEDEEFQRWLQAIPLLDGPTCDVSTAISTEDGSLPETFMALGNYPNPFRQTTHLTFDLPWPSHVRVEVTDVIGRHVLTVPDHLVEAGWGKSVELDAGSLPAGFYLYRLTAKSNSEHAVQVGRVIRIR